MVAAVVVLLGTAVAAQAADAADIDSPVPLGTIGQAGRICEKHDHIFTRLRPGGRIYLVRNTYWRGIGKLCVSSDGRPDFRVISSPVRGRRVTSYPAIYRGCIWNMCTPDTDIPVQTRHISHLYTDWSIAGTRHAPGSWNASYDMWFGKSRMVRGHADGAEVMLWLNRGGRCCAFGVKKPPIVTLSGLRVRVIHWVAHDAGWQNVHWNYVQFRLVTPRNSVKGVDLRRFIDYAVARGWVKPWWWMENVNAGFELWAGGNGLRTTAFSVALRRK